jgi:hypothetical protein
MIADAAASKLDETKHRFSAASAAWLSRLQLRSALIAKHRFSSSAAQIRYFGTVDDTDASTEVSEAVPGSQSANDGFGFWLRTENRKLSSKTKRLPGNLGSLFFQGRIVPTEV